MKILSAEIELLPDVRLIGRRYADADRNSQGLFADQWAAWFASSDCDKLRSCRGIKDVSDAMVGAIRCTGNGFEYWIGMFMSADDTVPAGFDFVDIPACKMGVAYIYGNEASGEIYGMEATSACRRAFAERGWRIIEGGWQFERYVHPRYTTPDESGNVILDYCIEIG